MEPIHDHPHHTHVPHEPKDNPQMIPMAIVVAGALIAAAIFFSGSASRPVSNSLTGTNSVTPPVAGDTADIAPITSADRIQGNLNAQVIAVEYSDLECPFCKVFHTTMRQIMSTYNGNQVAWVYRHFPIAQLHSKAPKEAEASECAFEQGGNTAFWNFINKVFDTTNSNNSLDPAQLPQIAASVGLDVNAFNTCLASGKYAQKISDAVAAAQKAGAQGTPYTVLISKGGQKVVVNGAEPFATVKAKIDSLLK